ncbi:DNA repair protein RecO [Paraburkholderia dipogonis]|uniref:DNA repair protein RecO n=1 Tax=Paraburkholderia dipogonis TaxID=1211383 RepID=UPI0035EE9168
MGTNDAWMTLNSDTDPDDSEPAAPARDLSKPASKLARSTRKIFIGQKVLKAPKASHGKTPTRRAPRTSASDYRIAEQPAFVLHSYPYRETSLIIDVLSRDHGRLALVAKGAKRPHSALRGVLQTFQPLALSWSGKSEVRTLTGAEWVGGMLPLAGDALLCGFYVNELLVKFCAREDPHPQLFHHYVVTMTRLAHDEPPVQVLRSFERVLLRENRLRNGAGSHGRAQSVPALDGTVMLHRPDRAAHTMRIPCTRESLGPICLHSLLL